MTNINYNSYNPYNQMNQYGYPQPQGQQPYPGQMQGYPQQQGYPVQQQPYPGQQYMPQGQSFEANGQLSQDALEIAQQGKEKVKENFIFRALRGMGVEDPKKLIKSVALMVGTVFAIATLGNKTSNKMARLGQSVDDVLLGTGKIGKGYQRLTGALSNAKKAVGGFFMKSNTVKDVVDTMQNRFVKPTKDIARGYGRGFKAIFSLTPIDTLQQVISGKKDVVFKEIGEELEKGGIDFLTKGKIKKLMKSADFSKLDDAADGINQLLKGTSLETSDIGSLFKGKMSTVNTGLENSFDKLFGAQGKGIFEKLTGANGTKIDDNVKFCTELTDTIANKFGLNGAAKEKNLLNFFEEAQKTGKFNGLDLSEFTNVNMNHGGLPGAWWPVNIIDSAGKKIFKNNWKGFCRGNFFDSMTKVNVSKGSLAKTFVGKLVQKSILIPSESISNFVNDKSGVGALIGLFSIVPMFNNVQDAPKGKKASTVANDFAGGIGSFAFATPMAFATTYGLASLSQLKGNGIGSKVLRTIGKFFHTGLGPKAAPVDLINSVKTGGAKGFAQAMGRAPKAFANKIGRVGGGAMRFALVMFVFNALFAKPINKAIQTVFGKPYDAAEAKAEEEKKQREEFLKNHPEIANMTQEQILAKLQAHPEVVEAIQNDPNLMAQIQNDPTVLLQIVASLPDTPQQPQQNPMMPGMPQNPYQQPQNPYQPQQQNPYMNPYQQNPYQPQGYNYPQQNPMMPNGMPQNPYQQPQNPYQQNPWQQNPYQQNPWQQNNMSTVPQVERSYIPSSKPVQLQNAMPTEDGRDVITNQNVQSMLAKADKAEKAAMRYL